MSESINNMCVWSGSLIKQAVAAFLALFTKLSNVIGYTDA